MSWHCKLQELRPIMTIQGREVRFWGPLHNTTCCCFNVVHSLWDTCSVSCLKFGPRLFQFSSIPISYQHKRFQYLSVNIFKYAPHGQDEDEGYAQMARHDEEG